MPIFYLEPKAGDVSDPRWAGTALKEGCWVQAESEYDARLQVDQITHTMIERSLGWPLLFSPWRDPKLTVCRLDTPDFSVPVGVVVTAGGKTFP